MKTESREFLKKLNILLEYVVLVCVYFLSGIVRIYVPQTIAKKFYWKDIVTFIPIAILVAAITVLIYQIFGDYATVQIRNPFVEFVWVLMIQMVSTFITSGLLFMTNGFQFSRCWLLLYAFMSVIAISAKRYVCQKVSKGVLKEFSTSYKVLVIGAGPHAKRFLQQMSIRDEDRFQLVGYLAERENPTFSGYLGTYDNLTEVLAGNTVSQVVITEEKQDIALFKKILTVCSVYGIPAYVIPVFYDYMNGIYGSVDRDPFSKNFLPDLTLIQVNAMNTSSILGVKIAVTNMNKTLKAITRNLEDWRGKYICVSNVHTTVMAHDNLAYRQVQNGAVMALPDGAPLSSYSRTNGSLDATRVTGPDLMREILKRSPENGWKHFFYGSTQETLDKLKEIIPERYPGVEIAGMISPPFRELTPEEDNAFVEIINESKADFLWVGLGAPKQEVWMAAHKNRVNCLMVGVGAAFDYEAGNIKRAPKWMQKLSLEWLYRLLQDPKRLFKRYFVTNLKYLWLTRR